MNDRTVKGQDLTANEWRAIELLRKIKDTTGHGTLTVEVRDRLEQYFEPTTRELPPIRARGGLRC